MIMEDPEEPRFVRIEQLKEAQQEEDWKEKRWQEKQNGGK